MSNNTVAGFRLSTQQERLWSQMTGKVSPFWAECELLVEGPLDAAKLQGVVRGIVVRHEILRTVFHRQTGLKVPFQVILDTPDFAWETADLTGMDESAQRQKLRESRQRTATPDSILSEVPRSTSCWRHSRRRSMLWCSDFRLFVPTWARCRISPTKSGGPMPGGFDETAEVMQYADVAEWQQELLASDDTKPGRDYWRDYCRKIDFSALDSVLSAFERRSSGDFLPDVVVKQVEVPQLASLTNGSLQDFLLACWQVFLSRMTGRTGITVGCQFDGRNYPELANLAGRAGQVPAARICMLGQHDIP